MKNLKVHIEVQPDGINEIRGIGLRAFNTGIEIAVAGVPTKDFIELLSGQKCVNVFNYCVVYAKAALDEIENNTPALVMFFLNIKDPKGLETFRLLRPDYPIENIPKDVAIMQAAFEKNWVVKYFPIHFELRNKLRESNNLGVIVVDAGTIELFFYKA